MGQVRPGPLPGELQRLRGRCRGRCRGRGRATGRAGCRVTRWRVTLVARAACRACVRRVCRSLDRSQLVLDHRRRRSRVRCALSTGRGRHALAARGAGAVLVSLALERGVVVDRGSLGLRRRLYPPLRLLHHVGELVAEQFFAALAIRIVLPRSEVNISAAGISDGTYGRCLWSFMNTDGREIGAERGLHLVAHGVGQRPPTVRRRYCVVRWPDSVRRVRVFVCAALNGAAEHPLDPITAWSRHCCVCGSLLDDCAVVLRSRWGRVRSFDQRALPGRRLRSCHSRGGVMPCRLLARVIRHGLGSPVVRNADRAPLPCASNVN